MSVGKRCRSIAVACAGVAILFLFAVPSGSGEGRLPVTPGRVTLEPGEEVRFEIDVGTAAADWEVIPRSLGTIDGNGLFVAGEKSGRGIVRVIVGGGGPGGVGHAVVRVGTGRTTALRIEVTPRRGAVEPGGEIRFEVRTVGGEIGIEPVVEWRLTPGRIGTISPDGLFRAGNVPMEGRLIATAVTMEGTARTAAMVRVGGPGEAGEFRVRPRVVKVLPGESVRFRADGIDPALPVDWAVFPSAIGTITPDGLFTANEVIADAVSRQLTRREGVVIARAGSDGDFLRGRARILIGDGELPGQLVIEPKEWSRVVTIEDVLSGRGIPFRARFLGPSIESSPVVRWRIEPTGVLHAAPVFGNRTVVSWEGSDSDVASFFPYRGRLIAELVLPNGAKIGASALLSIRLAELQPSGKRERKRD